MLDPSKRLVYLEQLKPPPDYSLDTAFCTTFSLDLLALFAAQLSLANLSQDSPDVLRDPTRLLEAIRQSGDRITLFCQRGQISAPNKSSLLFSYLEELVHEVTPAKNGVFHPKLWLLRYVQQDGSPLYRLICLSRNLTFDRSWDTMLVLDGKPSPKGRRVAASAPLAEFIQRLSGLSTRLSDSRRESLLKLAAEVQRVEFTTCPPFDGISVFHPIGHKRGNTFPEMKSASRALIVSPFITSEGLSPLLSSKGGVLISSSDQLDALPSETMSSLTKNRVSMFTVHEAASLFEDDLQARSSEESLEMLSGLHAKLYLLEKGAQVSLFTGSANATSAARSKNIEFLIELTGRRTKVGIDVFLGDESDKSSLRSMLLPYRQTQADDAEAKAAKALDDIIFKAKAFLYSAKPSLVVDQDDEHYTMRLQFSTLPTIVKGIESVSCYPITQNSNWAQECVTCPSQLSVVFGQLALASVTGLLVFQLHASKGLRESAVSFVMNVPVLNMPERRDNAILRSIVSNRESFLRYLAFLLGDASNLPYFLTDGDLLGKNVKGQSLQTAILQLPLLEELVRATARRPEKLHSVQSLVSELRTTKDGAAILPPGFDELWEAIMASLNGGEGQ